MGERINHNRRSAHSTFFDVWTLVLASSENTKQAPMIRQTALKRRYDRGLGALRHRELFCHFDDFSSQPHLGTVCV